MGVTATVPYPSASANWRTNPASSNDKEANASLR